MNTSRRLTVAAAVASVVLCVVAACSSPGAKGQGALGDQASSGASGIPSVGATGAGPGGQPTVTPNNHGSKPPSSPPHSAPSSPAVSPPASVPNNVYTFQIQNDLSIVATGKCYWTLLENSGQNDLQVAAEFTIAFSGLGNPTSVPFTMTASPSDGYQVTGAFS